MGNNLIKEKLNAYLKNIIISEDYNQNLNELRKICDFLKHNKISNNLDFYIDVITSFNILKQLLKIIVEKNIDIIKNNELSYLFDNKKIILFIEAYCIMNNIGLECNIEKNLKNIKLEYTDNILLTYLNEINKPLLTKEEEYELFIKYNNGDLEAKKILIERNLKLVVSIAKRYRRKEIELLDLIQEGNIGLMMAIEKFDINKNYKFSSYAIWWIEQSIVRAIAMKSRNIKLPYHVNEKIIKYKKIEKQLEMTLNRKPSIAEIAEQLKISLKAAEELKKLQNDIVSLDMLIGEDEDDKFINFIASDVSVEDEVIFNIMKEKVNQLFECCRLTEKEIYILKYRYGFYNEIKTYKQMGKEFNITPQAISSAEIKALRKLRSSKILDELVDYIDVSNNDLKYIIKK